jgi:predicted RNA-binding protein YlxR (DUF448 family)/ribosomal protein L30E
MPKAEPQRTCIVTGEELTQQELLRFVVSPEGKVVFDLKGNLPGRGMYVKPQKALLAEACKRNLFARAAKQKVQVDAALPDFVEQVLKERALAFLGRAQLAGDLVTGNEKVLSMLKSGEAEILIHASDAAEDGMRKLNNHATATGTKIVVFCGRDEMGEILKKANPVHMGMKKGGISSAFIDSYDRWAGFLG